MRIVTTDKEGLVKRPEDAKAVTLAGELFKFVVKSEETGGAFSLIELTVEPFSPGRRRIGTATRRWGFGWWRGR